MPIIKVLPSDPSVKDKPDTNVNTVTPYLRLLQRLQTMLIVGGYYTSLYKNRSKILHLILSVYNIIMILYCLVISISGALKIEKRDSLDSLLIMKLSIVVVYLSGMLLYMHARCVDLPFGRFKDIFTDIILLQPGLIKVETLQKIGSRLTKGVIGSGLSNLGTAVALWLIPLGAESTALFRKLYLPFYSTNWTYTTSTIVYFSVVPCAALVMITFAIYYCLYLTLTYFIYKQYNRVYDNLLEDSKKRGLLRPHTRFDDYECGNKKNGKQERDFKPVNNNVGKANSEWDKLNLSIFERARLEHDLVTDALNAVDDIYCCYNGLVMGITVGRLLIVSFDDVYSLHYPEYNFINLYSLFIWL